ncbi:sensor histidine kinase [Candidatus Methylomicrobium oryzae]|uniref:sensor histidine kinase n=1 Tax=Candidatus Methylomicrobium oryzae TaxID=2802053 RepID=UPI0019219D7E|nr:HAMP domain-containing sensor histidine kinase [Methylomicrobium sp. RS1]MBL1264554.1 HAMP domain-containing histidine kinase [Methylomicrobium sp. RS1]
MKLRPPLLRPRLFRLRTILLCVMLMVLVLPLGGLYFFRIYENELVQQTERELIAQAAALSAGYRQLLRNLDKAEPYGRLLEKNTGSLAYAGTYPIPPDAPYTPIFPGLSLFDPIQPPRPLAKPAQAPSDELARRAGMLLRPILQDTQQITLSGIRLLSPNGVVIAGREEVGLSLAQIPEVAEALQGRYAGVIRQRISDEPPPPLYSISRGANIRVFIAFPVLENGRLQGVFYLSRTPDNILKHLYAVKGRVLLAGIGLLAIVIMIVTLASSAIARPIRELILQTEKVKSGEQKVIESLQNPATIEIARLSESFADMSRALSERTDYIRRFATHVSHEFKTPLTSIQGALELLQDHAETMPEERRQRFIANLLADTYRLRQLVNRLLELAHADALRPSRQVFCNLPEVIDPLKHRYAERGLQIELDTAPVQSLAVAPEVLEAVFVNLFENSLQHGATQLQIRSERRAEALRIGLQDNGTGISRENRGKIFTPFFTTRRNAGGTGLGLEIVASLLKAYGAEIELGECLEGALFWVCLPIK